MSVKNIYKLFPDKELGNASLANKSKEEVLDELKKGIGDVFEHLDRNLNFSEELTAAINRRPNKLPKVVNGIIPGINFEIRITVFGDILMDELCTRIDLISRDNVEVLGTEGVAIELSKIYEVPLKGESNNE